MSEASLAITTKEACAMLGVSSATLWRIRRRDPSFPAPLTLGGIVPRTHMYDRKAFEEWYHRQARGLGSVAPKA